MNTNTAHIIDTIITATATGNVYHTNGGQWYVRTADGVLVCDITAYPEPSIRYMDTEHARNYVAVNRCAPADGYRADSLRRHFADVMDYTAPRRIIGIIGDAMEQCRPEGLTRPMLKTLV